MLLYVNFKLHLEKVTVNTKGLFKSESCLNILVTPEHLRGETRRIAVDFCSLASFQMQRSVQASGDSSSLLYLNTFRKGSQITAALHVGRGCEPNTLARTITMP